MYENEVRTTTDYINGFQYKITDAGCVLEFFPHAEGYIKPNESSYKYIFNYNDHLGNVRLSYSDTNNNGSISNSEILEENHYYPFGLKHRGYNANSLQPNYKYKYNGKEYQDELGLNMYDYGWRNYMPDIGRWGVIGSKAEAYYPITPYQYVLNNPLVNADVKGQWTITRHYNLTYNSLSAAGIGKEQADLLAHYASVYADNPGGVITLNNIFHPTDENYYRYATIDYSGTKDSQITDWNGKRYNHNIWHSMRSGWEKDNDKISAHDATERGMEFGWGKVFESAKSGKLNDLIANSKGIQAFGQGVHALQDAYAHNGTTMEEHSAYNDRYGNTSGAKRITDSAVTVHNILSGNWSAFDGKNTIKFDAQGMSRDQYNTVMNAIYDYLKKEKK
ncbi:RHS repeat-associated core domain-containing protein [Flavobacterium branchiophilum]|uniref:RHS repeat domain-containing protein n=1 Tax=Flavobacterium branchiophilum TaxID=55197 RepID=UPI00030EE26B|nr:RHS repeat-associated core domain-containing protein [Flavobacterium branchiophilum]